MKKTMTEPRSVYFPVAELAPFPRPTPINNGLLVATRNILYRLGPGGEVKKIHTCPSPRDTIFVAKALSLTEYIMWVIQETTGQAKIVSYQTGGLMQDLLTLDNIKSFDVIASPDFMASRIYVASEKSTNLSVIRIINPLGDLLDEFEVPLMGVCLAMNGPQEMVVSGFTYEEDEELHQVIRYGLEEFQWVNRQNQLHKQVIYQPPLITSPSRLQVAVHPKNGRIYWVSGCHVYDEEEQIKYTGDKNYTSLHIIMREGQGYFMLGNLQKIRGTAEGSLNTLLLGAHGLVQTQIGAVHFRLMVS